MFVTMSWERSRSLSGDSTANTSFRSSTPIFNASSDSETLMTVEYEETREAYFEELVFLKGNMDLLEKMGEEDMEEEEVKVMKKLSV